MGIPVDRRASGCGEVVEAPHTVAGVTFIIGWEPKLATRTTERPVAIEDGAVHHMGAGVLRVVDGTALVLADSTAGYVDSLGGRYAEQRAFPAECGVAIVDGIHGIG